MAVALVVAAGRGERLGTPVPKAFANLAGRPMVEWSIAALQQVAAVTEIVVALPPGVAAPAGTIGVPGGSERSHSVRAALAAAARRRRGPRPRRGAPAASRPSSSRRASTRLADADAAIAATPVTDTIKECEGGRVVRTLDRSRLWAIQTPQVFRRDALERALAQDDAVVARPPTTRRWSRRWAGPCGSSRRRPRT